ncbi:MAG: radical SAM protein [Clostridiales bacterium]|nr:radical SAM protein [Clostridiales bacterium]
MEYFKNNVLYINENRKTIMFHVPSSNIFIKNDYYELDENSLLDLPLNDFKIKDFSCADRIKSIVISCAETCNLRCSYCFAHEGTYNNDKKIIMSDDNYDKLLYIISNYSFPLEAFCFFCGEPLLGFKHIQRFVSKLEKLYSEKEWNFPILGIVTNGTLITEEIVNFFSKYNVNVSISIDGFKEENDANRYYEDRNMSVYDNICENLKLMKSRNFKVSAVATLSRERIRKYKKGDYSKLIEHFIHMGFDAAECMVADEMIPFTQYDDEQLRQFANDQIDYLFENIEQNKIYHIPKVALGSVSALIKKDYKLECPAGNGLFYYTANGYIYPCQLYYAAKKNKSDLIHRTEIEACKNCFCINLCTYYCAGSSVLYNGSENSVIGTRCALQKHLTIASIKKLAYYFSSNSDISNGIRKTVTENLIKISKIKDDRLPHI